MTEHTAASSQPNRGLNPGQRLTQSTPASAPRVSPLLRVPAALALSMPVVCGAMLGWWEQGLFDLASLIVVTCAALAGSVSVFALWEYFDSRRIPHFGFHQPDASLVIMRNLGVILGISSILCGLLLAMLVGWPMLFFTLLSYTIALLYAAPPIRYGYRGWGLGELGVFVSFGLLAVPGGYYALTQELTWTVVAAALPLGLLAVLVVFNANLKNYRRDWLIRKRTLVVSLGPTRGLDVSALLAVATYGALVAVASLGYLPLWTLLSLVGLPLCLGAYSDIWRPQRPTRQFASLYAATLNAAIVTNVLLCLALWLDKSL